MERKTKVVFCLVLFATLLMVLISRKEVSRCGITKRNIMNDVIALDRHGVKITRKEVILYGNFQKSPVYLMIGIPTVYRQYNNKTTFYIEDTLRSLLIPLSKRNQSEIRIIIMLGDRESWKRQKIAERIREQFSLELRSGLLNIIGVPDRYYLQLVNLFQSFNDSPQRMYWRSKQSIDYAFIFNYAHKLCHYYMQIEDDVLAKPNYYGVIKSKLVQLERNRTSISKEPWNFYRKSDILLRDLEFSPYGFVGRVFEASYLPFLSNYFRLFYDQIPVDWTYVQAIEFSHGKRVNYNNLFEHIGIQSSSLGT